MAVTPVEVPVPDSVAVMFCAVTLVVTLMVDALEVVGTGVTVVPVDVTVVVLVLRRAVVVIGALVVVKVVDWFVLGPDADGDGVVTAVVPVTFPAEAVELPLDVQIRLVSQKACLTDEYHGQDSACLVSGVCHRVWTQKASRRSVSRSTRHCFRFMPPAAPDQLGPLTDVFNGAVQLVTNDGLKANTSLKQGVGMVPNSGPTPSKT